MRKYSFNALSKNAQQKAVDQVQPLIIAKATAQNFTENLEYADDMIKADFGIKLADLSTGIALCRGSHTSIRATLDFSEDFKATHLSENLGLADEIDALMQSAKQEPFRCDFSGYHGLLSISQGGVELDTTTDLASLLDKALYQLFSFVESECQHLCSAEYVDEYSSREGLEFLSDGRLFDSSLDEADFDDLNDE